MLQQKVDKDKKRQTKGNPNSKQIQYVLKDSTQ